MDIPQGAGYQAHAASAATGYNFYSIQVTGADWQSQLGPASNLWKQPAGRKGAWCGGFTGDPSTATQKLCDLGLVTSPLWPQFPQLMKQGVELDGGNTE